MSKIVGTLTCTWLVSLLTLELQVVSTRRQILCRVGIIMIPLLCKFSLDVPESLSEYV